MAIKFLGQRLVDSGVITDEQLQHALEIQSRSRFMLGELAIEYGYLDKQQVIAINDIQRKVNGRFGDVAQQEKLLTASRVEVLIAEQRRRHRAIGEVLVDLGYASIEEVEESAAAVEAEGTANDLSQLHDYVGNTLSSNSTLFTRILHAQCKHSHIVEDEAVVAAKPHSACVTIKNDTTAKPLISISLVLDDRTLIKLASNFMKIDEDECDIELSLDALGEYLNVLAGYVINVTFPNEGNYSPASPVFGLGTDALRHCDNSYMINFNSQLGDGSILVSYNES